MANDKVKNNISIKEIILILVSAVLGGIMSLVVYVFYQENATIITQPSWQMIFIMFIVAVQYLFIIGLVSLAGWGLYKFLGFYSDLSNDTTSRMMNWLFKKLKLPKKNEINIEEKIAAFYKRHIEMFNFTFLIAFSVYWIKEATTIIMYMKGFWHFVLILTLIIAIDRLRIYAQNRKGQSNNKQTADFEKCTTELRKADKYYISFRILNRWGYYFQGLNCLLFSLETFFKLIFILNSKNYLESELKGMGHNLKKAFNKINLDRNKFDLIYKIISSYGYTEIRYFNPDLVNEINHSDKTGAYIYLEKLHKEIEDLHKLITVKIRGRFNAPQYVDGLSIYLYHSLDPSEKKALIDDCISKGDPNLSVDNC